MVPVPPREVLGEGSDPADVGDALLVGDPATFSEHCWIGIKADRVLEQVGESDSQAARPAANVEEPSASIQIELRSKNSLELGRIGRSTVSVMGSGALIDRGVIPHPWIMPARRS